MSTTSSIKLGDDFLRIPKLDVSGSNWVIFKARFQWALDARGLLDHVDGTATEPVDPIPASVRDSAKELTADQKTLVTNWEDKLQTWRKGEAIVKQQIAGTIPDSLFMKICKLPTAFDVWAALASDHEQRSRMYSVDLRRRLQMERCSDKGDMRVHLAKLRTMHEDLAAMGHPPADDDFSAIILGSLPKSYEHYVSALNATDTLTTISPDKLMVRILEESERRGLRNGGKEEDNSAYHAGSGGKQNGKGSKKVECYNCRKRGHVKAECWAPGGGKEGQKPQAKGKAASSSNTTSTSDSSNKAASAASASTSTKGKEKEKNTGEAAWMAEFVDDAMDEDHEVGFLDDFDMDVSSIPDVEWEDMPELLYPSESDESDDDDIYYTSDVEIGLPYEEVIVETDDEDADTSFDYALLSHSGVHGDIDLYDSGATSHMSGSKHRFINFVSIAPKSINAADKRTFHATGKGDMYIWLPNANGETTRILLRGVLYAPAMNITLISISRVAAAGYTVVFSGNICRILDEEGEDIGQINVGGGLYRVHCPQSGGEYAGAVSTVVTLDELHRRLGHISHEAARQLVKKGMVEGITLDESVAPTTCEPCENSKMTRRPIARERVAPKTMAVGDEVHSDLWGPSKVETIGHRRYFMSLIDDFSRYVKVHLLFGKDEAFETYRGFEAWMGTQKGVTLKCLHTDRGGEFISNEFSKHLAAKGTERRLTVHDTPEYNGVAERMNRTLLNQVRAVIIDSGLPNFLWGEALLHIAYVRNRSPTRALDDRTPYEVFHGRKPNISNLPIWGSLVRIHDPTGSKLSPRGVIGHWVGFDEESLAHRIYWPSSRRISVERSVLFNVSETVSVPLEGEESDSEVEDERLSVLPEDHKLADSDSEEVEAELLPESVEATANPRRSTRTRAESRYVQSLRKGEGAVSNKPADPLLPKGLQSVAEEAAGVADGEWNIVEDSDDWEMVSIEEMAMASVIGGSEGLEPTYAEARRRPDWPKWQEAIQKELDSLKANGTWELVERPDNANVVDSKWVFRIKKNAAGEIEKYKARLVARGFTQIYGVDYYQTYAPVAKLSSFRLLLAVAARNGWPTDSFDFDSAYLNGELDDDEVVYMEQPPGHEFANRHRYVLRLIKALYGLKQSARVWYNKLFAAFLELGFKRSEADHGVFYKEIGKDLLVVAVHVDDCLATGSSAKLLEEFKGQINSKYRMTDLGPAHWLLGIKVTRDLAERTISLSQHSYIDSIITRFNFNDLKPVSTPMDANLALTKAQSPSSVSDIARMRNVPYREAVGSLMYAAMGTRPDIAFAVTTLAQFSDNPGWVHWEAVKRVFKYLLGTRDLELVYGRKENELTGYVDADGASQEHRRAISGYVFLVDGGAISWSSKKQELVTLSTAEAEYVAATHAAKEVIWLRRLIGEVFGAIPNPTTLFSDSQSAIALTKDGHYHARTKHIDIRYHFIRYVIENGSIKLIYCPTNEMTADVLTKALPSAKVKHFASALGLATV